MVNKLPNLPKLRRHKEADITPDVIAFFRDHHPRSVAIEVKILGGKLKPHQTIALKQVEAGSFSFKIPDRGARNPFDAFVLKSADAYVVVCDNPARQCSAYTPDMEFKFKLKV